MRQRRRGSWPYPRPRCRPTATDMRHADQCPPRASRPSTHGIVPFITYHCVAALILANQNACDVVPAVLPVARQLPDVVWTELLSRALRVPVASNPLPSDDWLTCEVADVVQSLLPSDSTGENASPASGECAASLSSSAPRLLLALAGSNNPHAVDPADPSASPINNRLSLAHAIFAAAEQEARQWVVTARQRDVLPAVLASVHSRLIKQALE